MQKWPLLRQSRYVAINASHSFMSLIALKAACLQIHDYFYENFENVFKRTIL
jgi:hypothetical protein